VKGSVSLFGFLSAFLLFLNLGGRLGLASPYVPLLGFLAAAFLAAFIAVEARTARPLLDLGLFRNRLFAFSTLSAGLQPACTATAIFLAPYYLTEGLGYSGAAVGVFMAVLALPHVLFAPLSGKLSDRLGPRLPATFAMGLACVALWSLSRLGNHPHGVAVGVALLLVGASIGIFLPPNNSAIMGSVPKDTLGSASALLSTARQIGSSSGIAIAGALFSTRQVHHLGRLAAEGAVASAERVAAVASFSDTLLVGVGIGVLGLLTSSLRGSE
jgi:predicted MFS family arabinose efflux permease